MSRAHDPDPGTPGDLDPSRMRRLLHRKGVVDIVRADGPACSIRTSEKSSLNSQYSSEGHTGEDVEPRARADDETRRVDVDYGEVQ